MAASLVSTSKLDEYIYNGIELLQYISFHSIVLTVLGSLVKYLATDQHRPISSIAVRFNGESTEQNFYGRFTY